MPEYLIVNSAQNTDTAEVDDVTVSKGGPAVELTQDQVDRLKAAGVSVHEEKSASKHEPKS